MNKFQQALAKKNNSTPPIWLMRQAGRYHAHYQERRQKYGFLELCKNSDLACEVTMGPIEDFDFDAAILFSDILFPSEEMGLDLDFNPGPKFNHYLREYDDLKYYKSNISRIENLQYQADALRKIRSNLPSEKGLIGFVGGLATLYIFAVEGTHKKDLTSSLEGLKDGRFDGFIERMLPMLVANMVLQAKEKPDCIAILDSAAGALPSQFFETKYRAYLDELIKQFKEQCPDVPVLYYGKNLSLETWKTLKTLDAQAYGIDHSHHMPTIVNELHRDGALQGNLPPETMSLPEDQAIDAINTFIDDMLTLAPEKRTGWICGLGHGILPTAKEANVRHFIRLVRERL